MTPTSNNSDASINYSVKDLLALSEMRATDRHAELMNTVHRVGVDAAQALAVHQASDTVEYHRLNDGLKDVANKIDQNAAERRREAGLVKLELEQRIAKVDARVDEYDKAKTAADTLWRFGKWLAACAVIVLGLIFAYMSTNGYGTG